MPFLTLRHSKGGHLCLITASVCRFEMRGLLVNNEDLLRTNSQLTNEMKRMREQMIEMERENQSMGGRHREMEV